MKTYVKVPSPTGRAMWKGNDLAGVDAGYSLVDDFIKENEHAGWSLSIFDSNTEATIEVGCDLSEMPRIVAYIYNLEHAYPMTFIGENALTESYVIGMRCTRGRIDIPSIWKVENGKLVNLF
jgi:hypothetical protein ELI_2922